MRRLNRYSLVILILAVVVALLFVVDRRFRFAGQAAFKWQMLWQSDSVDSLRLDEYRVEIEAQVIRGLEDDVSALSYDPDRKSLFTVTNQRNEIVELSLDGRILRRIPLVGFGDSEAVEYISQGVYVISDERRQRLIRVRIDDSTQSLDAANAQHLTLALGSGGNKGFEGLAYDSKGKRLFIAKEREPVQIIEVRGFPRTDGDAPDIVEVTSDQKRNARLFVRDLSSLLFDERSGHLLALSDESRQIVELDTQGHPIGSASLTSGNLGLNKTVPQAEGIAMDDQGTLYVVSEPNLFYVFRKPQAQTVQ
jgi:uncharacterized protein YjiK